MIKVHLLALTEKTLNLFAIKGKRNASNKSSAFDEYKAQLLGVAAPAPVKVRATDANQPFDIERFERNDEDMDEAEHIHETIIEGDESEIESLEEVEDFYSTSSDSTYEPEYDNNDRHVTAQRLEANKQAIIREGNKKTQWQIDNADELMRLFEGGKRD
jgi:hypothetical protein